MGQLATPPDLRDARGIKVPDYARARLAAAAMASKAGLPANMDAWDGYPAARARLLASALDADANRSEEHTSELQSLMRISYAVFCLKKNKNTPHTTTSKESLSNQDNSHINESPP